MRAGLGQLAREVLGSAEIEWDPPLPLLHRESLRYAALTRGGQLAVTTRRARARLPSRTLVRGLPGWEGSEDIISSAASWLQGRRFYAIERCVGAAGGPVFKILGLVDAELPHLALMLARNYFHCDRGGQPDIVTIDSPGYPEQWILVDPVDGANLILGSDYYGELKMSFLRLAMNRARDSLFMLGLHAGSKGYTLRREGRLERVGVLIFGLSGTGKTTLTLETHGLERPERVLLYQDDIVILDSKGTAHGTEMNLYPKTDSVPELPALQPAVLHQDAILENVTIKNGEPDFTDLSISPNARAIAIREAIPHASPNPTLEGVKMLVFLTRRPEMPALARLTSPEQAVAYFMLGESWRTSAEAGRPEPVRVPGFDPFMLPPKWRTALLLLDFIRRRDLEVLVMNTGSIGPRKVTPEESKRLLLEAVRGTVQYKQDPDLGLEIAVRADDRSLDHLHPRNIYGPTRYREAVDKLREERTKYIQETLPELSWLTNYI